VMRLADKTAMRIMSISRAVRRGIPMPAIVEAPSTPAMTPIDTSSAPAMPAASAPGELPGLAETPVDNGTIMQGGDMFDAITKAVP